MKKIKISILGCTGKTGKKILQQAFINKENFEIKNCLVSSKNEYLSKDLSFILQAKEKVGAIATDDISEILADHPDVIIDFSVLDVSNKLMDLNLKDKKIIIGLTGIDEKLQNKINNCANSNIIFQSSNMSVGVALINNFLKANIGIIENQYSIIINDIHHKHKKDSPSGTALSFKKQFTSEKNIDIHSSRVGNVSGIHEILMINDDEIIKISHEAQNRDLFAIGALKIAQWLQNIDKNGLYNMEDFLKTSI